MCQIIVYKCEPPFYSFLLRSSSSSNDRNQNGGQLPMIKNPKCNHIWAEIVDPCSSIAGFLYCSALSDARYRSQHEPPIITLRSNDTARPPCPTCDIEGYYDRNRYLRIDNVGGGTWKDELGVEWYPVKDRDGARKLCLPGHHHYHQKM
ncbi:hypothetical protein V8F20_008956 [Naviculisporaceae sp. PSN 640]